MQAYSGELRVGWMAFRGEDLIPPIVLRVYRTIVWQHNTAYRTAIHITKHRSTKGGKHLNCPGYEGVDGPRCAIRIRGICQRLFINRNLTSRRHYTITVYKKQQHEQMDGWDRGVAQVLWRDLNNQRCPFFLPCKGLLSAVINVLTPPAYLCVDSHFLQSTFVTHFGDHSRQHRMWHTISQPCIALAIPCSSVTPSNHSC